MPNLKAANTRTIKPQSAARQAGPSSNRSEEQELELPAAQALTKPAAMLKPAEAATLQRAIGNRALTRLLQRQGSPKSATQPGRLEPAVAPPAQVVQRQPTPAIQRSLGPRPQPVNYVLQHSTQRQLLFVNHEKDRATGKITYELWNTATGDNDYAPEDDADFDWVFEESEATGSSSGPGATAAAASSSSSGSRPEGGARPPAPAPAAHGPLPLNQRSVIKLYMGQGTVGDLSRVQMTSGQFATCSPVIMYNSATHLGGLYHYPAGRLTPKKKTALAAMMSRVQPTEILALLGLEGQERYKEEDKEWAIEQGTMPDWYYLQEWCDEIGFEDLIIDKFNHWGSVTITLGDTNTLSVTRAMPSETHDLEDVEARPLPPEVAEHFGKEKINKGKYNWK